MYSIVFNIYAKLYKKIIYNFINIFYKNISERQQYDTSISVKIPLFSRFVAAALDKTAAAGVPNGFGFVDQLGSALPGSTG